MNLQSLDKTPDSGQRIKIIWRDKDDTYGVFNYLASGNRFVWVVSDAMLDRTRMAAWEPYEGHDCADCGMPASDPKDYLCSACRSS